MKSPEQLKGFIRNLAIKRNLKAQEVLQMFLFERVLIRLSVSPYQSKFILKGGLLISSMIGVNERTTMDMDTTVQGISMEETEIVKIIKEILLIDANDNIVFEFKGIEEIREDDAYNNFRINLQARYGKINSPMKIDITTGDIITTSAIQYDFPMLFEDGVIEIWAYTIETILAEKIETIIRRNIGTTRLRDYYDVYMLYRLNKDNVRIPVLKEAILNTAEKRSSLVEIQNWQEILKEIEEETYLEKLWKQYVDDNRYIQNVSFEDVINTLKKILNELEME
ncbi:MAG: nucleotidyl transferase AbiEii/AbiGii toxin family protein [Erysipelotrichaceae bacterium]|nr:nucleotidyl transferase AbiEii/AbiGii toxin family protein [Erysipelotrichaceae bacterium]